MIKLVKTNHYLNNFSEYVAFLEKYNFKNAYLEMDKNSYFSNYDLSNKEIKLLKRKKIVLLNPNLDIIDFDKDENIIEELRKINKFCKKLKIKNVIIKVKTFNYDIEKHEIKKYFKKIKKYLKQKLILLPEINQDYKYFAYLFKDLKIRKISLVFSPKTLYLSGFSINTAFLLLNRYVSVYIMEDYKDNNDFLLCYGELDLQELIKKIYQSKYKKMVLLSDGIYSIFDVDKKEFKKYTNTLYWEINYRIYENNLKTSLTFNEVYENQIEIFNKIFLD